MSHYASTRTNLTVKDHLVAALNQLGLKCEVFDKATQMRGFAGNLSRSAEIIIRKADLQNYPGLRLADAGFVFSPIDNCYTLIADDYIAQSRQQFIADVSQAYAEQKYIATMETQGFIFTSREVVNTPEGPEVELLFASREI